jgi:hypothetical protein
MSKQEKERRKEKETSLRDRSDYRVLNGTD